MTESLGSNNWVVDGTLTASGKPLLANDPHLGTRLPSTWYLVHISAGDYEAAGASIPGTPAIVLGRNRFIAWGATNVAADVEDLYQEKLDPTGRFAEFRGRQEPLQIIPETILVKGARAGVGRRPGFPTRSTRVRRHHRQQRGHRRGPRPPRARTVGVPVDRARSGRHDDRRDHAIERGAELGGIHRRAPRFRGAGTEFRVCRRRRAHRLLRAGPHPDSRARRRRDAVGGMDRRLRVDRLGSVRRSPARLRSARARDRDGQSTADACGLPVSARRRLAGAVSRPAGHRSPSGERAADARRVLGHAGRPAVAARANGAAGPARARASGIAGRPTGGRPAATMES